MLIPPTPKYLILDLVFGISAKTGNKWRIKYNSLHTFHRYAEHQCWPIDVHVLLYLLLHEAHLTSDWKSRVQNVFYWTVYLFTLHATIMFLTRQSVCQSDNLLRGGSPLKSRIWWNFVVMKIIYCVHVYIYRKFLFDCFLRTQIDLNGQIYIVLCKLCKTAIARVHEFEWHISCLDMFLTVNVQMLQNVTIINRLLLILSYDFLSDCPSLMHDLGIRYVQHFQIMTERGVCELAHPFFHFKQINEISINSTIW